MGVGYGCGGCSGDKEDSDDGGITPVEKDGASPELSAAGLTGDRPDGLALILLALLLGTWTVRRRRRP